MITVRTAAERGQTRTHWLDSRHSFSFGDYADPRWRGFGPLLVINEDRVIPGAGFPTHGHRDMEIVSVVVAGALAHKDSLGAGSVIRSGEVQRMSAGTGIRHSEYNASPSDPLHFLQIWIEPEVRGLKPSYEQKALPPGGPGLTLLASRDGREGSLTINRDAALYRLVLPRDAASEWTCTTGRRTWLQVIAGRMRVNDVELGAGDGAAVTDEPLLRIAAQEDSEGLLFDLPAL